MRTITNQNIRDAYYKALEDGSLGPQGACSYLGGCIIGVALTEAEMDAIHDLSLDNKPVPCLVDIVGFEDLDYATRLQEAFDRSEFKPEMLEC